MTDAEKVLQEIHNEWAENWDMIIDFFGKNMADKIDKVISIINNVNIEDNEDNKLP